MQGRPSTLAKLAAETGADIRHALRTLVKTPGLTAVIVLTLALGLGATTAVFSVVNTVALRPLPYASPDRLVRIVENVPSEENGGARERTTSLNVAELDWWRTNATTLSHIALIQRVSAKLATDGGAVQLYGAEVSPALFAMRGVPPLLGRGLAADEERPDADVIVLGEAAWREQLAADPGVIGRRLTFADRLLTVVGVMPRQFGPEAFWVPLWAPSYVDAAAPEPWTSEASARLREGVSLSAAAAEVNALGLRLRGLTAEPGAAPRFEIVRELDEVTQRAIPALRVLAFAAAAVLLIVCTNVANLLLVRGTQRQQEIAIRRSLGATRARIVRLVMTESLVLAAFGGLGGLGVAFGSVEALRAVALVQLPLRFGAESAPILPRFDELAVDPVALAFVAALTLLAGTTFGALPALRLSRFGERGHSAPAQISAASTNTRVGHALATAQLACALALLIAAGLLLHSFAKLSAVDPGIDPRGVLSFEVIVPDEASAARKLEIAETLAARLEAHPQVSAVGFTDVPPLTPGISVLLVGFAPEGMPLAAMLEQERDAAPNQRTQSRLVSAGYLRAFGARLVAGRWLGEPGDTGLTVVVSRSYAERFFPLGNAVGSTLRDRFGVATIVGVIDDIHFDALETAGERVLFLDAAQLLVQRRGGDGRVGDDGFLTLFSNTIGFAARTSGDPLAIVADVRALARDIDPSIAIQAPLPLEHVVAESMTRPRFYAVLIGAFGAIATFIAVIGSYGVLAYLVGQRTKEIGVRIALGAAQSAVLGLVLRRGVAMVAIGITAGVLAAIGLTRYLEGMLYGITTLDVRTYAAAVAAFAAVALLATYLPARRATAIDPLAALRHE